MIQLHYRQLSPTTFLHLGGETAYLTNAQLSFEQRVDRATKRWRNKTGNQVGIAAFQEIKNVLKEMCSGTEICVYCEHNEATDIEHIFPKRLYPEKCFVWENYLLACGRCNTHYKKEFFKIFHPKGGHDVIDISPRRNIFNEPQNADAVFINQRDFDPFNFLEIDFGSRTFLFLKREGISKRDFEMASFTVNLLGLNTRADLVEQRKAAFKFYKGELQRYASVFATSDMPSLQAAIDSLFDNIDRNSDFQAQKDQVLLNIENRIKRHSHPTIWKEMQRQRQVLNEVRHLFEAIPVALGW